MKILDTRGKVCPFPLVDAKEFFLTVSKGEEVEILFDCTQATESIPLWAAEEGYEVSEFESTGPAEWRIIIKK